MKSFDIFWQKVDGQHKDITVSSVTSVTSKVVNKATSDKYWGVESGIPHKSSDRNSFFWIDTGNEDPFIVGEIKLNQIFIWLTSNTYAGKTVNPS